MKTLLSLFIKLSERHILPPAMGLGIPLFFMIFGWKQASLLEIASVMLTGIAAYIVMAIAIQKLTGRWKPLDQD